MPGKSRFLDLFKPFREQRRLRQDQQQRRDKNNVAKNDTKGAAASAKAGQGSAGGTKRTNETKVENKEQAKVAGAQETLRVVHEGVEDANANATAIAAATAAIATVGPTAVGANGGKLLVITQRGQEEESLI